MLHTLLDLAPLAAFCGLIAVVEVQFHRMAERIENDRHS